MSSASQRAQNFLESLELRRKSLRDEVEEDVGPLRGLSLEERGRILESVCRDAMAVLKARPDAARAIEQREARSAESMATWLKAVARYRHGRH
jgi:hypothetical protein